MHHVRLLGGIEFASPTAAATLLPRPKSLALLAWLVAHCDEGPRQRDEAQRLLWEDSPDAQGRNSLRQALYHLRQALGADAIQGHGSVLELNATIVSCDLVDLDRALRDGRHEEAVQLYRGDFLHGLFIPRAPRAMGWLSEAQRVRRLRVSDAAASLAAQAHAAEDADLTLRWARRAVELMDVAARPGAAVTHLVAQAEAERVQQLSGRADTGKDTSTVSVAATPERAGDRVRVAGLPFLNLTGSPTDNALAEGIASAVTSELAEARNDIERVPLASTRQVQTSALDFTTASDQLHAHAIVSGTLARNADELAVAVQLLGRDGRVVWADRVTTRTHDIDSITGRLATGLAGAIPGLIAGASEVRRVRRGGRSQEAVVAILRGSHFVWRLTPHDLHQALEHFLEATRLDPGSAPAWAGVGQTLLFLPIYSADAPPDTYARAILALDRAIALDPGYATSYAARAVAAAVWEWKFDAAEQLVRRAHDLDPTDHEAWVADLLYVRAPLGQAAEALDAARHLVALDPASPLSLAYASLGAAFFDPLLARRYAQDALRLEPSLPTAHWSLAGIAAGLGDHDGAREHADLLVDLADGHPGFRALRALLAALAGRHDLAREELAAVLELPSLPETGRYYAVLTLAHLGELERALGLLETEVQARNSMMIYLGVDPALFPLRGLPRFEALRKKVRV